MSLHSQVADQTPVVCDRAMAHCKNLRPAPDICYELFVLVGVYLCGVIHI
jgi:hypothetical protein